MSSRPPLSERWNEPVRYKLRNFSELYLLFVIIYCHLLQQHQEERPQKALLKLPISVHEVCLVDSLATTKATAGLSFAQPIQAKPLLARC
jgi:hypothetical protein